MQSIPKFVLKRLQERAAPAELHPDADLLTAFAEQSLDKRERALLTEHLAACADCREIVALALPVTETLALPAAHTALRFGWLSWPTLRWAALSAAILVVGSAAILHYSHRSQLTTVASNVMQKDSTPARSVVDQVPALHATLPPSAKRTEPSARLSHSNRTESTSCFPSAASPGSLLFWQRWRDGRRLQNRLCYRPNRLL